ncbi:M1 family metallopeptidase [Ammoniphilus sp. CFH 90114]|uniref:M1 family metallopeptidase n=1 Tax=Ammoniphilus sp. CFH 90114 TaxID=2493665 RepID=UPI00100EEEF3|nr:M1 family metallopeptidase [Ammoniphilus sp. CFH 90114]RXT13760.1 M1 family peptidase [Ammoniphilus sp. CFH 90114]
MQRWILMWISMYLLTGCGTGVSQEHEQELKQTPLPPPQPQPPHYEHRLMFEPEGRILQGETSIEAWNRSEKATDEVYVQLFLGAFEKDDKKPPVLPKSFSRAYPHGIQLGRIDIQEVLINGEPASFQREKAILQLDLPESWGISEPLSIDMLWTSQLPMVHHRLGMQEKAVWFGNVLPILAVYDGEWHANQYEAVGDPFYSEAGSYEVEITTPEEYQVVMTGEETEQIIQGKKVTTSSVSQARDFVFAVSPDHQVQSITSDGGKQIHLHYRLTAPGARELVLKRAKEMLDYMEQRVGIYPYTQLDIYENEMFITGMEYPGLVFVRSDRLNDPRGIETVVHEIAHQWFYNIVGNDPLREPWLDEGFATYFADEFLHQSRLTKYYAEEGSYLKSKFPQTKILPVEDYQDWSSYWRGNYRKSSLMIFALRQELGDEAFSRFIKEYTEHFQFKIVKGDEFQSFVQQYTSKDLKPFFQEWLP